MGIPDRHKRHSTRLYNRPAPVTRIPALPDAVVGRNGGDVWQLPETRRRSLMRQKADNRIFGFPFAHCRRVFSGSLWTRTSFIGIKAAPGSVLLELLPQNLGQPLRMIRRAATTIDVTPRTPSG